MKDSVSPVVAIILMILITLILGAILYSWASCGCVSGEPAPIVQLDTNKEGEDYRLTVTNISSEKFLVAYAYFLKDDSGLTKQYGEIALQNISGEWHGIDVTWDDKGPHDPVPDNGLADKPATILNAYSDPNLAQNRIDSVKNGCQVDLPNQKSEGNISVSFIDADVDGRFTIGDHFIVKGHTASHPANDDWKLEIKYKPTDDTIGSFKLGGR